MGPQNCAPITTDAEHAEVPAQVGRALPILRSAQAQPAVYLVGVTAVDEHLLHHMEADVIPCTHTGLDVGRALGLLVSELVARKCQYFKPARMQLLVQRDQLRVPLGCLAS